MIPLSKLRFKHSNFLLKSPIFLPQIASNLISPSLYFSLPAKGSDSDADDGELEMIDPRKLPTDYDPSNFDPTEHRSPPTDRVFRLVDEVSALTLAEVSELSSILVRKLRMEPPIVAVMNPGAAAVAMAGAKGAAGAAAAAKEEKKPEKTVYELRMDGYDAASKIKIIKEVRSFTDLGLKDAKELVEKTPAILKRGVSKEEGEQLVEKLKALGAKVVLE